MEKSDHVVVSLNTQDMKKLNITYILSKEDLSSLSNDNVTFSQIFEDNGVKIYKIKGKISKIKIKKIVTSCHILI